MCTHLFWQLLVAYSQALNSGYDLQHRVSHQCTILTTVLNYHHHHTRLTAFFPELPRWASTRKVKPIWILLKQETVNGSGISWATCKYAPCSRQTNHTSTPPLCFLQAWCPSCRPTNSVKALKAIEALKANHNIQQPFNGLFSSALTLPSVLWRCLQCFDAVGWAAGRASGL